MNSAMVTKPLDDGISVVGPCSKVGDVIDSRQCY